MCSTQIAELGAAQRAGEADQQQRAVAQAGEVSAVVASLRTGLWSASPADAGHTRHQKWAGLKRFTEQP
jgi:hypothetical protein